MEREKSCGAVLDLMKEGKRFYLIEKMRLGHYYLVKGHVEGNETEEDTALRESKEETNLDAKLDTSFRQVITYSPKVGVIKDVVFFVGEIVSLDVKAQEEEINQILFLEFEDAINTLTYESDKEIFRLARRHLK
jgi:8-oxo-dGTP pyrophosphatase MutT (NUDIX family)